jgi:peptidoglycan/LPS O-acetylase OafA/YrhL
MNAEVQDTRYLTGVRGIAAFLVFFTHFSGGGLGFLTPNIGKVVAFGKFGVVVFFVLSAFTLALSISKSEKFSYPSYLKKRFLRIVPLYLFLLIATLALTRVNLQHSIDLIIRQITFSDLFNMWYRGSVIGASWTLAIEVFFYLLIPFIFFGFKKYRGIILSAIILSFIIYLLSFKYLLLPYYNIGSIDGTQHFSVERYVFPYVIGIALFFFIDKLKGIKFNNIFVGLYLIFPFIFSYLTANDDFTAIAFVTIWTLGLIVIGNSGNKIIDTIFNNRAVHFLGLISYSFYLIHAIALQMLPKDMPQLQLTLIAFVVTMICSTFTYYVIEKPFIALAKKSFRRNKEVNI